MKVNTCGIKESEFVNGWCKCGRSECEMHEELLIEERIYNYFQKIGLIPYSHLDEMKVVRVFSNNKAKYEKLPKYIKEYIQGLVTKYDIEWEN